MNFIETGQNPLEGALNTNVFVRDENGNKLLKRCPKSNLDIMQVIAREQAFIGFTALGGGFRRRTPDEQANFTLEAAMRSLRVLPPSYRDEAGTNYYTFLEDAQTLDKFLPSAPEQEAKQIVLQIFTDLERAHSYDFVYGDRWSENMLIVPKLGLMHIDFDLEIYGRAAKELEVAQVAFYALCGGRDKVIPLLGTLLGRKNKWYNIELVEHFAKMLAIHFQRHEVYGNAIKDVAILFEIARLEHRKRS